MLLAVVFLSLMQLKVSTIILNMLILKKKKGEEICIFHSDLDGD